MRNGGLEEAQVESRLLGEISITSAADDTTLMAESEEELKSLLMKVKECQSPAPVDPGNSKRGQRPRGSGNNCLIKR